MRKVWDKKLSHFTYVNILHIFNDGFEASFFLLLPFIAKDLHINLTQVGTLGTFTNIFIILLSLPAGYFAKKIGGLKTLILAMLIYGVGLFGIGVTYTYYLLMPMFMFGGIGFGLFHPIGFALVAKWSTKENRGRQMGNFTAIGDLGRIGIASILTFIIVYIGWQATALAYACVAFFTAIIIYFHLRANDTIVVLEEHHSTVRYSDILKNARFLFATVTSMLDSFASTTLFIFLPFLLLQRGVSPLFLGSFTAAFFVGNFLGKLYLGRAVDNHGNIKVFMIAELLMAILIVMLANSSSFLVIIFCSVLLGIFTKGTVPVIQTIVSDTVEHHGDFTKAFSINSFTTRLSSGIAPLVLGFISDKFGIVMAFNVMAVVAVSALLPVIFLQFTKRG